MIYLIKSLEKSLNGVGKFGIWIQKEMRFLSMGEKAIFVESSTDTTNRVKSGSSQEMESVLGRSSENSVHSYRSLSVRIVQKSVRRWFA